MSQIMLAAVVSFLAFLAGVPLLLGMAHIFGVYAIVHERRCHVYVLFGKVVGVIDEPGLFFLWPRLGWKALFVRWLGRCAVTDMRLDQEYLRSQPVNSEEGAPMGIGIWYEMFISDPVAYLFKNIEPRGSLAANVSNSTVRCLSNLPLSKMLIDRHAMSRTVRDEVTPKSNEWGYQLGSIYIRKVHFRDPEMIRQIESKVVNRLRQVTAAIKQDGVNQVSIIKSAAERRAAVAFGKAAAVRPAIVGKAMTEISADAEIAEALFELLETQRIVEGQANLTLLRAQTHALLTDLLAAEPVACNEISGHPAASLQHGQAAGTGISPARESSRSRESRRVNIECPKCGQVQPKSAECVKCGIVFSKFNAGNQRKKAKTEGDGRG
jgi:regulator of protease activity HflC (stomatin/prohibitin superfamily)